MRTLVGQAQEQPVERQAKCEGTPDIRPAGQCSHVHSGGLGYGNEDGVTLVLAALGSRRISARGMASQEAHPVPTDGPSYWIPWVSS